MSGQDKLIAEAPAEARPTTGSTYTPPSALPKEPEQASDGGAAVKTFDEGDGHPHTKLHGAERSYTHHNHSPSAQPSPFTTTLQTQAAPSDAPASQLPSTGAEFRAQPFLNEATVASSLGTLRFVVGLEVPTEGRKPATLQAVDWLMVIGRQNLGAAATVSEQVAACKGHTNVTGLHISGTYEYPTPGVAPCSSYLGVTGGKETSLHRT